MIIACPACATRYEVPDSAIRAGGRTVRCAKCRHSWFQDADGALLDEPEVLAFDEPEDAGGEEFGADTDVRHAGRDSAEDAQDDGYAAFEDEPASEPAEELQTPRVPAPEPVAAMPVGDAQPENQAGPEESSAAEPKRRGLFGLWAWAALVFVGLAGGMAAAASWWGVPDWLPLQRPAFAATQPGLELDFPAEQQERRQLPNGAEYFGASGTITNVAGQAQEVPPILIVLRDQRDRIVYSWEVAPPKRQLAPGESVTVNEAITDVPRSARVAEIGWKPV